MSEFLRIACQENEEHVAVVLFKGAVEQQSRWYLPQMGYVAFHGYEAEGWGKLPPRNRKIIEFVGDSITEGVLIDAPCVQGTQDDMLNRVYQDDVTATYAYLAARMLDLEPVFMGYGAVGATHGGCGGVPSAPEAKCC